MAENLLSDARVRTATRAKDGPYLPDGGGLRIRLGSPTTANPRGLRHVEFHFKLKVGDEWKHGAIHVGNIGEPFNDGMGVTRPFTLSDARAARDAARALVGKGIDPREARKLAEAEAVEQQRQRLVELETRRTVTQAFDEWHRLYLSAHRKDGGAAVRALFELHLLPPLGALPLESLRRAQITDVLDKLTAAGRRRTANMSLALLRQFVRWCAVRDWIARDPTLALSKASVGGKEKPRERVLSTMEIVELREKLSSLPERMRHAAWLILATGCRVSELAGARAADFDLRGNLWHLPETKNGTPHLVHLSAFALIHVNSLIELGKPSEFLLPGRFNDEDDLPINDKAITKMIGDRQRGVTIKGRSKASGALLLTRGKWTPHDLRRTMATRMREDLRVSSDVVERCLNHRPQGIAAVYQTGELMAERRAAFEAWGERLQELMSSERRNVVELRAPKRAR